MSKLKFVLAAVLALINIGLVAAINISPEFSTHISSTISIYGLFAILAVTFIPICYLGWWAYSHFAQNLDPAGACITGFTLPFITAFLATLCWSALAVIGGLQATDPNKYLGRFDQVSLIMIFVIFMLGGFVWGALMRTPEYDNKTQENVAVGYTVMSYWFGFIVFSWIWLVMDRLI